MPLGRHQSLIVGESSRKSLVEAVVEAVVDCSLVESVVEAVSDCSLVESVVETVDEGEV